MNQLDNPQNIINAEYNLLSGFGNLGFYKSCEVTTIFLLDKISKQVFNYFSIFGEGNGDRSRFPPLIYIFVECSDDHLSPTWGNRPIESVFLALIFAVFCGTVGTGSSSLNTIYGKLHQSPSPCCVSPITHYQPFVPTFGL